jgi:adenylate cyclase
MVTLSDSAGPATKQSAGVGTTLMRRPAVAILPFTNMSGDQEQEYFVDGITEDIITELAKASWFPVTARNSTFSYKGQSPDVRKVARELGAAYVVEGSVRKAGNRIRITAQLIDASNGQHIWAERYDR